LGGYFIFVAYYLTIGLLTDGGFGGAAIKRISENEEPDAFFSAFVILRSIFVTAVIVALIVFRNYFVDLRDSGTFSWLLLALLVSLFQGAISSSIQGRGKMGINSTGDFIDNVTCTIVQVFMVFFGFGVAGLAGGFVAGMFAGSLVRLRFFDLHFVKFRWSHIKSLAKFSFFIFLITGGSLVLLNSDAIMIAHYMSDADVGVYRIALQFTTLATFTTTALRSTLWPKVSYWGKNGDTELIELSLSRALTYSLLLAIPMFAGGTLLGDKLLYFFYGNDFAQGYTAMVILFIMQIVVIFHSFFSAYISALDHPDDLLKITVFTAVANVLLNAVLIPSIGIAGAAIATLVTLGVSSILTVWVLSKMIKIQVEVDSLLNIIKASIIMSIIVGGYRMLIPISNLWLALVPVLLGAVVFGVLVLKFDRNIYNELKEILIQRNVVLS
jgi:O-antigen/teichoic acid export membrane protein